MYLASNLPNSCLLHFEIDCLIASIQHIQDQYIEMKPLLTSLVKAYPAVILDSHVSHQSYMWAVQVINSPKRTIKPYYCQDVFSLQA